MKASRRSNQVLRGSLPVEMTLGTELWFDYAHRLPGHSKCERPHGHTAKVVIEIVGILKGGDDYRGHMIMDFSEPKDKCRSVLSKLDHSYLNIILEYPSSENTAQWIFQEINYLRIGAKSVTFYEGTEKRCRVERKREDIAQ